MDTRALLLFLEVARAGSFAAVARARGLDPTSVSRAVQSLEEELGLRLLERSTRALRLTEAGDRWLAQAGPLAEELVRLAAEAREGRGRPEGTLRLSASVTFGNRVILPRLPAFRAFHPGVAVEGLFTDANLDLVADRIDLAVRLAPEVEGDVVVSKLLATRYRVVAAPAYLAAAPPLSSPDDLSRHRMVLFALRPFRTRWLCRRPEGPASEHPVAGDLVLSPASAVRDAALLGLGPALLPDWLVDEDLARGRLVDCLVGWEVAATTFDTAAWLVYPSRSFLPAKVRAMIDFLREATRSG